MSSVKPECWTSHLYVNTTTASIDSAERLEIAPPHRAPDRGWHAIQSFGEMFKL
jgi:hypothetical protein